MHSDKNDAGVSLIQQKLCCHSDLYNACVFLYIRSGSFMCSNYLVIAGIASSRYLISPQSFLLFVVCPFRVRNGQIGGIEDTVKKCLFGSIGVLDS